MGWSARSPTGLFYGASIIDASSHASHSWDEDRSADPSSVRVQAIAAILLQGIRRCIAVDRNSEQSKRPEASVSDNLGDSLPETLDFAFEKPLSVSHVSKTLGFGDAQDMQNGGKS
jgi:hypothetical protein